MYVRDDSRQDWSKLITAQHIDEATRCVKRLSQSLYIAILISFIKQLPSSDSSKLIEELSSNKSPDTLALHWDAKNTEVQCRFVPEECHLCTSCGDAEAL